MLEYSVCKKLKEAGFPQEETTWVLFTVSVPSAEVSDRDYYSLRGDFSTMPPVHEYFACPTLSELISECGEELDCFMAVENGWEALGILDKELIGCNAKTPESAVAALYLVINEKKHD